MPINVELLNEINESYEAFQHDECMENNRGDISVAQQETLSLLVAVNYLTRRFGQRINGNDIHELVEYMIHNTITAYRNLSSEDFEQILSMLLIPRE